MVTTGKVEVGKTAPDFRALAVVDGRLKELSLSAYIEANHWVVLVFFPKAWSFICPTEIKAFSTRLEEFLYSRSCAVVFCSTDSEHCLKAWNNTSKMEGGLGGVHVPLMTDCNGKISKDYGVLIDEEGVSQRALFIIDPRGTVRAVTVNDADVGRSVDETLRLLDALSFKDEFGEGCPVDWKQGDKGINTTTQLEGKVELKKSWSEWARPKLTRAWSGASQRSIGSIMSTNQPSSGRLASPPGEMSSQYQAAVASAMNTPPATSPLLSPTNVTSVARDMQGQMDEALLLQRMENTRAAMDNSGVVGMAT